MFHLFQKRRAEAVARSDFKLLKIVTPERMETRNPKPRVHFELIQEPDSQYFIFFVTYKWAEAEFLVMCNTSMNELGAT
jgi:hypothetical protein